MIPEMINNGKRDLLLSQMHDRSIIILTAVVRRKVCLFTTTLLNTQQGKLALAIEVAGMCISIIYFN